MNNLTDLEFFYFVWFMENGDDQWRPVAGTFSESDGQAIVNLILEERSGDAKVLPASERPEARWYI